MEGIALHLPFAAPSRVFVPVRAEGTLIMDNGGDVVARCFTAEMASRVAELINSDAGIVQ